MREHAPAQAALGTVKEELDGYLRPTPLAGKIAFRQLEGIDSDFLTDHAARDVVGRRMDAAPDAGEAALVRGVTIGGPLQRDVDAGSVLEDEEFVLGAVKLAHAAGKKGVSREQRHDFRRGPRESGMPGDVTGKGRCHEGGSLVGPPVFRQDPIDARHLDGRVRNVVVSTPGNDFDLSQVLALVAGEHVTCSDHFYQAINQVDATGRVSGKIGIGTLPHGRHAPNGRYGSDVVIPALDTPGAHRRVVNGAGQDEVGLHVPLQLIQLRPFSPEAFFRERVVAHIV